MGAVDHLERILIEQVIQEPVHGILDGRKSIMGSMNVVGVILLTVAIYTIQAGNSTGNSTKPTTKPTTIIPTTNQATVPVIRPSQQQNQQRLYHRQNQATVPVIRPSQQQNQQQLNQRQK